MGLSTIAFDRTCRIGRRSLLKTGLLASAVTAASPVLASEPIHAATFDLSRYRVSLHWKDEGGRPYGTIQAVADALGERGQRVVAVTNAGIYERDLTPLGLHIEDGKTLRALNRDDGDGNFFLKPNGVFSISNETARISETGAFVPDDTINTATQSGPLLVLEGAIHPAFQERSDSLRSRNAVGVRSDGTVVLAMTRVPVNFWTLAVFMRDRMGCPSALYLDGAISQLWQAGDPPPETRHPYVGMLAVTER